MATPRTPSARKASASGPASGKAPAKTQAAGRQLDRVRRICGAFPETLEKISHGEPTFFARKKVFVMFDDHHHGADHIAVWLPAPQGLQEVLVGANPGAYFRPPYVGVKGWIGVRLDQVDDATLADHVHQAWRQVAPSTLQKAFDAAR